MRSMKGEKMAKTLYLMRHGETLFNELKLKQGWSDSPLTEKGKAQAKSAHDYFKRNNINFLSAYSSTQERATDTLKLITDAPYVQVKDLKERNFGYREATPERYDPKREPGQVVLNQYFVDQGGESVDEVLTRYKRALHQIMENDPHDEILVVAHGVGNYLFFSDQQNSKEVEYIHANCSIIRFFYDEGQFIIDMMINPADLE